MTTPADAPDTAETTPARPASSRRVARALAIVGGTVAALVVWALAKYAFDVELRVRQPGSSAVADVGIAMVVFAVVVWSLLGWALLAILERSVARARTIWTWIALAGLVLSFVSPLTAQGATSGTKITLAIMHVVVAAVVIPVFARTSPRS